MKLPAPSTVHTHPSLLGANEFPDTAGPLDCGSGVAEACGEAEAGVEPESVLEEPQLPNADWHPVPQYVSELPMGFLSNDSRRCYCGKGVIYHTTQKPSNNVLHMRHSDYRYKRCYRRTSCLVSQCACALRDDYG